MRPNEIDVYNKQIIITEPYLEITEKCNLSCPYCFNDSGHSNKELSKELFFKLLNELNDYGVHKLTLTGGEPSLHSRFGFILDELYSRNIQTTVITNGTIHNKNILERFIKYNVNIQLTVDAPTEAENAITRGAGTLAKNIDLINYLNNNHYAGVLIVRINLSCYSKYDTNNIIDLMEQLSVDNYYFAYIKSIGRAVDCNEITNEAILKHINVLSKSISANDFNHMAGISFNLDDGCPYFLNKLMASPRIDCRGNIYPCSLCTSDDTLLGNIQNITLKQAFSGKEFSSFLSLAENTKNCIKCERCTINKICKRCCPAQVDTATYSDSYCNIRKQIFKNKLRKVYL